MERKSIKRKDKSAADRRDTPNKEKKEREMKEVLGEAIKRYDIITAQAHISIESWVLGCFEDIRNPENFPDSNSAKRKIEEKMLEGSKGRIISVIAERNQVKHFERSDSFKEFESIIEKFVKL